MCKLIENMIQGFSVFVKLAIISGTAGFIYGAAYWYPHYCWWGTLVSMILVICLHGRSSDFFLYGLIWAAVAYSMHLYGVVVGVARLAAYTTIYAWVPGIALLVYLSLVTGIIWWLGSFIEQYTKPQHYFFWGCWLTVYWLFITYVILWPAGCCEGYLLANPIVPWAAHPSLLVLVPWIGVMGMTIFVCLLAAGGAYLLHMRLKIVWCMVCLFFVCCWFISENSHFHDKRSALCIAPVPKYIPISSNIAASCRLVHDYVRMSLCECDQKIIRGAVFPESSVYQWDMCAQSLLAEYIPIDGIPVADYIIGSFCDDAGAYRNSCYWMRDGMLQKRFDKRHTMPLIERMPWWLKNTILYSLFFNAMPEIVPSDNERPIMMLGEMQCVPYICSELFFNRVPDDIYPNLPIIALINDRWCPFPYMQQLMYLGAVVQAYAWQRDIFYVSYSRCVEINH